jgi:hypothetical protein
MNNNNPSYNAGGSRREAKKIVTPPPPDLVQARTVRFACLVRPLLKHPPLQHRGGDTGLTVFETAVLGAVICCARNSPQFAETRQAAAFAYGGEQIEAQKRRRERPSKSSRERAPKKSSHERRKNLRQVGAEAFDKALRDFELKHPLTVAVRQAELLRLVGVNSDSPNRRRLKAALETLRSPVWREWPPLIANLGAAPNGKLKLTVNPAWFPRRARLVLWPPPTAGGGSTVFALYLFLHGCIFKNDSLAFRDGIDRDKLCRLLGIHTQRPAHIWRALERALAAVNAHLDRFDAADRADWGFAKSYQMQDLGRGRVRFERLLWRDLQTEDSETTEEQEEQSAPEPEPEPEPEREPPLLEEILGWKLVAPPLSDEERWLQSLTKGERHIWELRQRARQPVQNADLKQMLAALQRPSEFLRRFEEQREEAKNRWEADEL